MIKSQWLELPMSRTNFHDPKDVRAIEVRLYLGKATNSKHSPPPPPLHEAPKEDEEQTRRNTNATSETTDA